MTSFPDWLRNPALSYDFMKWLRAFMDDAPASAPTGIGKVTAVDGSVVVLNPTGPTVDVSAKGSYEIKVVSDTTVVTTGDSQFVFAIPLILNGKNLSAVAAFVTTVSSSGAPTVQIRNVTDSVDMLTTAVTIDANETTSYTAATPPVIDTSHDDVATGDLIAVDVDGAGTGAKGLGVVLTFS